MTLTARYILLLALLAVMLFPIYWIVLGSLRTNSEITAMPPRILPSVNLDFSNYSRVVGQTEFLTYYKNSLIVSGSTIVLCIVMGVMAGYSFSRYRFLGRQVAMTGILSVQMFPLVAILISLFEFFRGYGLINSLTGLVLAHLTICLPFAIWFLKAFFDGIPRELEEAAYIDGAGRNRTLFQIIMPLARPGILAVGIYAFLMSWDDFLMALILTTRDEMRTLPVGIAISFIGEFEYDWSGMMSASMIASLPILILFIFLSRYMVEGLTQGALKG
jgi:multiple sugar transport system permease protein